MTIQQPVPGEPRRPQGPRDPGDAWVVAPSGARYWGVFGAAGLLAHDPARGVLLQHRVAWSHFGGTWGIPGGARHQGESAVRGALREAQEEAGVPDGATRPAFTSVLDLDVWTYTTLVAEVVEPFDAVITDPESTELAWVPLDRVAELELHPGFADSWPALRRMLSTRPVVVVDAANVVGSVPDGWWKDRAGAAERLIGRLEALADAGIAAEQLSLPATRWFPLIVAVVEGQARGVQSDADGVRVVSAPAAGDDELVAQVQSYRAEGADVFLVTSDRGLTARAADAGARVQSVSWLRTLIDAV